MQVEPSSPGAPPGRAAGPMPPLFVSHGSPMMALEPGATGAFFARLARAIERRFGRPRAVLACSAHTLADRPVLLAAQRHQAVHDFSGFPAALYELRYDAPGDPAVAERAASLLRAAGCEPRISERGGLDHGIWTVLMHMWPAADVPVVPLAFPPAEPPARLWALGGAVAPLADEAVLILGTGSLTHNLRMAFARPWGEDAPEDPACAAFRGWVREHAESGDWPALLDYRRHAPHAASMHPTDEHWLPFYPPAGAAGEAFPARRLHEGVQHGVLGMDAYAFGPHAAALADELKSV